MCNQFLYICYLIFYFVFNVTCFNLDTNFPIVYEYPNNVSHTYFGYSVILYPGVSGNGSWIQIAAPKPETIFRCGTNDKCNLFPVTNKNKVHSWLGGTMDINYETSRIIICAPKWVKGFLSTEGYLFAAMGACYWNSIKDTSMEILIPLLVEGESTLTKNGSYFYGQGQAGTSAEFTKDGTLILGAPGIDNSKGSNILLKDERSVPFSYTNIPESYYYSFNYEGYSVTSGYFYDDKTLIYVASAPRSKYLIGSVVLFTFSKKKNARQQAKETKQGTQFGEYFGASIAAGDINGDGLDDLIIGAPFYKSNYYNEGKIYIYFGGGNKTLVVPDKVDNIIGKTANGQFGLNIKFVGDLNKDGFGDVVVSAPYELEGSGVIYIYRGTSYGLDSELYQRIVGKNIIPTIKGFGISISKSADIDGNGYRDIAIGAHLSGHTILFRSNIVVETYHEFESQIITLNQTTRWFDVTECYNIVGEQMVEVPIRIKRIITVDEQLKRAHIDNKQSSEKEIIITPKRQCYNVTIKMVPQVSNIAVPIKLSLSHKLVTKPQTREITYISNDVRGKNLYCKGCPVHDINKSSKTSTITILFSGEDNVCKSSLYLTTSFNNLVNNTFILGSQAYLKLTNTIFNKGEEAYSTEIIVTLPKQVDFRSIPRRCEENKLSSSIRCQVANILDNTTETVTFELDMTHINTGKYEDPLIFNVEVLTRCENLSNNSKQSVTLKLGREADVSIIEQSPLKQYASRNLSHAQFKLNQQFQVNKTGISSINKVEVEIKIPHTLRTPQGDKRFIHVYAPELTLGGQSILCDSNFIYITEEDEYLNSVSDNKIVTNGNDHERVSRQINEDERTDIQISSFENFLNENRVGPNNTFYINCSREDIVCDSIKCLTGPYTKDKNNNAVLKLKLLFNVTAISDHISKNITILFATEGVIRVTSPANFVQSGNKPDRVIAPILIIGVDKEPVNLWYIILGMISGGVVLLIIVIALIRAGFFRRKLKEDLENLMLQEDVMAETHEIVDDMDNTVPLEDIKD